MEDVNKRYGREFGDSTFLGDNADQHGFFRQAITDEDKALLAQERARMLAWSHACAIPEQLIDPANEIYGPEWMLQRYAQTNFWFGYTIAESQKRNPALYQQMSQTVPRSAKEPVGVYEEQSVPASFPYRISPMGRIFGYAIPRVHIESLRAQPDAQLVAIQTLDETIGIADSPAHLLAILSDKSLDFGSNPKEILSHILAAGVLAEQNCKRDYQSIAIALDRYAPRIWQTYLSLSNEEKETQGIAIF